MQELRLAVTLALLAFGGLAGAKDGRTRLAGRGR